MFDPSGHTYFPGSNLILKGALDDYGSGNPINFASWMQYATIPMIINFFLCWLWLQMFYLGLPKKCSISRKSCNTKVNVFLVGPLKMATSFLIFCFLTSVSQKNIKLHTLEQIIRTVYLFYDWTVKDYWDKKKTLFYVLNFKRWIWTAYLFPPMFQI